MIPHNSEFYRPAAVEAHRLGYVRTEKTPKFGRPWRTEIAFFIILLSVVSLAEVVRWPTFSTAELIAVDGDRLTISWHSAPTAPILIGESSIIFPGTHARASIESAHSADGKTELLLRSVPNETLVPGSNITVVSPYRGVDAFNSWLILDRGKE